jgi:hypothetical protein
MRTVGGSAAEFLLYVFKYVMLLNETVDLFCEN